VTVQQQRPLVLASASPRRKDILNQLGLTFRVVPSGFDETVLPGEEPEALALRLARGKGAEVTGLLGDERAHVLAADTIVAIDRQILGKPRDDDDALHMLLALGGRTHRVITGVALSLRDGSFDGGVFVTHVTFRPLDERSARAYVATGDGRDAAGSYAVQGRGAGLITRIDGSYTNVVGLPAADTLDLLLRAGVLGSWP
jgi:septum formation protein